MKYNFINKDGLIILGQVLFKYEGTQKDVVIPEGITRIHHGAFASTVCAQDAVNSLLKSEREVVQSYLITIFFS